MIIVRVGLGLGNKHVITTTLPTGPDLSSGNTRYRDTGLLDSESGYPINQLNPVKVTVMTRVDQRVDGESDSLSESRNSDTENKV